MASGDALSRDAFRVLFLPGLESSYSRKLKRHTLYVWSVF